MTLLVEQWHSFDSFGGCLPQFFHHIYDSIVEAEYGYKIKGKNHIVKQVK